ncbi:MAG TPA: HAD family hydrolase [Clostridiaceae bacterium]|nr:HAD family hydrolase [Clostridiaceae bacterium]
MSIRGVLFDKDGTLVDFNSLWIPITYHFVEEVLNLCGVVDRQNIIRDELLEALGISHDSIDPDGITAHGTMDDVNKVFIDVMAKSGIKYSPSKNTYKKMVDLMKQLMIKYSENIKSVGDLNKLLESLRKKGIYIGIATSDIVDSAKYCMERLGILDYFDFIGGDDGIIKGKPHPDLMYAFCEKCGLKPEEVAVIGDTPSDMMFAKNSGAGLAVGVLCGVGSRKNLEELADIICPSTMDILLENGKFIWE